jgi:hypothetical protein
MAVVATDLVTRFAFVGSTAPLKEYNEGLSTSIKGIAALATGLTAFAGGMLAWANSIASAADVVTDLSDTIGVSVESIGELSYAAQLTGSSAESMRSSLSGLSRTVGLAAQGMGRGKEVLEKLGISARDASGQIKSADVVFMEFAQRANEMGLSNQERLGFASRLGIDENMIQLLNLSGDEIDSLRKKAVLLGRMSREQADEMAAYNDSIDSLKMGFAGLKTQLSVALVPQMKVFAELMTDKIIGSAEFLSRALKGLGSIFEVVTNSIVRMLPVFGLLGAAFVISKVLALGFAGAMGLLSGALAVLLSPVVLITAGLAALYLVVDDVMAAFNGGGSVLADFYAKLFNGRSMVEDLKNVWQGFLDILNTVWDTIKGIAGLIGRGLNAVVNVGAGAMGAPSMQDTARLITPQATNRASTVNQDVRINVQSTDPKQAATETQNALHRSLADGRNQAGATAR